MPVTFKEWEQYAKACGNFFTWSQELKDFKSAFQNYDSAKTDGKKEKAYECFKKWHESQKPKCKNEQQKLKAHCQEIEKTVKIAMVKKGTLKYTPQPAAIKSGSYTGFRGLSDKKGVYDRPSNIAKVGFALWPQAAANSSMIGNWFTTKVFKKYKDGASFMRYCVAEKDMSRPTIATAMDEGCGGYTGNFTYKFVIPGVKEVVMSKKVLGIAEEVPWELPLKMYISQDASDVKSAKTVAINLNINTHEVVFLKNIDPKYIVEYRASGNNWKDMPGV